MYKKQGIYLFKSYTSVSFKPSETQQNNKKCKKYISEN